VTDKRLASLPRLRAFAEVVGGVAFIAGFITQRRSIWSWLGLVAGLHLIAYGARTAAMEVRHLGGLLRVVNSFRSYDIPLTDIEGIVPDRTLPGALRLQVAGMKRPLRIDVTLSNREEREALRRAILQAMRESART
jgi:hypothetical protein